MLALRTLCATLLLAASLLPAVLAAQTADSVQVTADLGFVSATGNTDMQTLNAGEELRATRGGWGIKQTFSAVVGKTHDSTSASQWKAGLRGERRIGAKLGVYLLGGFERDRFAGIRRRFEEGVGLVLRAVDTPANRLEIEAGGGLTQQRSITNVSTSFTSLRGAGTYRRALGTGSYAQLATEVLPNLEDSEDLRVNSALELVAPLAAHLATKLSYGVRFDNLPQPGFSKTDKVFTAGLQIRF